MKSLIFFGSLRSKKLLKIILDRKLDNLNISLGKIPNCELLKVYRENFPYLEKSKNKKNYILCNFVEGLTNLDFKKILFYESIEYKLNPIQVIVNKKKINTHYFKLIKKNKTKTKWSYIKWKNQHEVFSCRAAKLWMLLFDQYKNKPLEAEVYWQSMLYNSQIKKSK